MGGRGRSWEVVGGRGRSWEVVGGRGGFKTGQWRGVRDHVRGSGQGEGNAFGLLVGCRAVALS